MIKRSTTGLISATDLLIYENSNESSQINLVKFSLSLLKEFGHKGPYQFTSVDSQVHLIEKMTLRENLCLNIQTLDQLKDTKKRYEILVNKTKNQALLHLLSNASNLDVLPSEASAADQQIVAICQALFQKNTLSLLRSAGIPPSH